MLLTGELKLKAAVLVDINQPLLILDRVTVPNLLRGQVLVRLAYSGVCHSQLMEARGLRGDDRFLPHMLGHEGTGRVEAIGEGVTKVKVGDWVVLGWIKGQGLDALGVQYQHVGGVINAGGVTTFNEMAVVAENRIVGLPSGVPLDVGVLFGCALPTGAGIITNTLKPEKGSTIAFFGLGGIGLSALMATKLFECKKVIAIDVNDQKLKLAKEFGATDTINPSTQNVLSQIINLTNGRGLDYAVEATGNSSVIELAFESIRRAGGLCIFASHPPHGNKISIDPFELICGKRIQGSWGGDSKPDEDIPKFGNLYRKGLLPLERLITKKYRLDQINDALDDLEQKKVGRPIIEISVELAQQYSQ